MSFIWKFTPDDTGRTDYKPYIRVKKPRQSSWLAPEHVRLAVDMKRDYVRSERGEAISKDKRVVIDKRPTIMVPERPKRFLTLVQDSALTPYR